MAATACKCSRPIVGINNFLNLRAFQSFPKFYSVFAPDFKEPTLDRNKIKNLIETQPREELLAIRIKPATNIVPCSIFYHEDVEALINYILRKGKREVAKSIVREAFTRIKHIQLRKYISETNEDKKNEIILNPLDIYLLAIKNVTPLMWYIKVKKSGSWFKVPTGVAPDKAKKIAIKWILESSKDKGKATPLEESLAAELLAASQYEGKSIGKKLELHKMCEANRGYAHYWWT